MGVVAETAELIAPLRNATWFLVLPLRIAGLDLIEALLAFWHLGYDASGKDPMLQQYEITHTHANVRQKPPIAIEIRTISASHMHHVKRL